MHHIRQLGNFVKKPHCSYGTGRQGISQFYLHNPLGVHPQMEWTIPALAFSAEAGPHLSTPQGWKAELDYAPPG